MSEDLEKRLREIAKGRIYGGTAAEAAEARATAAEAREAKLTEALEYVVSEYVLEGHVQEIVDAALTKEPGE